MPPLCNGRCMFSFRVLCVLKGCVRFSGPLCSSCPNMPLTQAFIRFFFNPLSPILIILMIPPEFSLFRNALPLSTTHPSLPLVSECLLIALSWSFSSPVLCSLVHLPSFSCTLILLLQSSFIGSSTPPIPFLTALGKLVDLVSPARSQWPPACCPGNNGRSLTNSSLWKAEIEGEQREWLSFSYGQRSSNTKVCLEERRRRWSAGQLQEVCPGGN